MEKAIESRKDGTFDIVLGELSKSVNGFIDASVEWREQKIQQELEAAKKIAEADRKARIEAEKREIEQKKANKKLLISALLAGSFGIAAIFFGIDSSFKSQESQLEKRAADIKVKLSLGNELEKLMESIELVADNQKFHQRAFRQQNKLIPEVQSVVYQALQDSREKDNFTDHQSLVRSVAISSDGKYLVSGSSDKTVKLWRGTNWQDWLEVGCKRIRLHPALASGKIESAPGAAKTCLKYGRWSKEEKAQFLVKQGLAIAKESGDVKLATRKFRQASKLDSTNVNLEELEAEANQLATQFEESKDK